MPSARRKPTPEVPTPVRDAHYTISQLASEFALTTRAIRFYEDEGLVSPRRHGQARIYGERERTRIKLILRGKRLGLALAEIREILDLYDSREGDRRQLQRFLEVLDHRRAQLEVQRADIDALLDEIGGIERDCRRRLRASGAEGVGG
jgi:DNA-binding transcriptional MerR regulator